MWTEILAKTFWWLRTENSHRMTEFCPWILASVCLISFENTLKDLFKHTFIYSVELPIKQLKTLGKIRSGISPSNFMEFDGMVLWCDLMLFGRW